MPTTQPTLDCPEGTTVKLKTLTIASIALVAVLIAECSDTPAGSNSEDQPKSATCSGLPGVQIQPVAYVERAGLIYDMTAYLLTSGCTPVAFVDPNLKITSIVVDASGTRRDPILNSANKGSPWKELAFIPTYPGRYGIHLIVEANVSRKDVANGDVEFVACVLQPRNDKAPSKLDVDILENGHGVAECQIIV